MEIHMKSTMITLLLLSLALTGCVVEAGPNRAGYAYYSGHAGFYGEHGYYR